MLTMGKRWRLESYERMVTEFPGKNPMYGIVNVMQNPGMFGSSTMVPTLLQASTLRSMKSRRELLPEEADLLLVPLLPQRTILSRKVATG